MRFQPNQSTADQDDIQVPFIPMADLMFNLLIFFILTSIFAVLETQIGIELPSAAVSEPALRTPQNIIINVDARGNIRVNDRDFTIDQLEQTLKDLAGLGSTAVLIRADKNTRHGRIVEILDACAGVDIKDISFVTLKERPDRNRSRSNGEEEKP